MKINLKGNNIELTSAINDYAVDKVTDLGKLLSKMEDSGKEVVVNFEVGKTTNHHKSGSFFQASCQVKISGDEFYATADKEDLYQAIDEVKDTLFGEISRKKDKKRTLFTRGARSLKKRLKGLKPW